jgi:tellurite resistance protein TehA-like permease
VRRLRDVNLPPDVFAVVMATGIVSVAAGDHGYHAIRVGLGALASVAFLALAAGLLARIAAAPHEIAEQARDPDVALRMFTAVAAAEVLALRWSGHRPVLDVGLALAVCGWLVLTPLSVIDVLARPREELRDHAHGAWLLPSVAASGFAAVAASVASTSRAHWLAGAALAAWVTGLLIYAAVTSLIVWRAVSGTFGPDQVPPDSWILMGALAAATLGGTQILAAHRDPAWATADARGLTLACWILASLWIPALLYAEVWLVNRQHNALRYQSAWWSAVFPLAMFSAASASCARELHLPALVTVSLVFFWIAATAWLMVAVGYLHRIATPAR